MKETERNSKSYIDTFIDDIEKYICTFGNRHFAIKQLSNLAEINMKTVDRILSRSNTPTYQTIFKVYGAIYKTDNEKNILANVPDDIKKKLEQSNPKKLRIKRSGFDLKSYFQKHSIAIEIFILSGIGNININTIAYRFGQYGIQVLEELEAEHIILQYSKQEYYLNPNHPELNGDVIKLIGSFLSDRYAKPQDSEEEGNNVLAFYAESLNKLGREAWLKIDTEAFHKKVLIAKQRKYKGDHKIFTYMVTDSMESE